MYGSLAPKNLEGLLGETFTIYKNNFLRFIAIVAIIQVPNNILNFIIRSLMPSYGKPGIEGLSPLILFLLIPAYLLMLALSTLLAGATIHAVSQQYFHRPISINRAYGFSLRKLGTMFGAMLLYYLIITGIAFIAAIIAAISVAAMGATSIGGEGFGQIIVYMVIFMAVFSLISLPLTIYLSIRWAFILPAILLEGCSPLSALSHSWALVKGSWWRVLGIVLLLLLMMMIIVIPISMVIAFGTMSDIVNEPSGGFMPYAASETQTQLIWTMVVGSVLGILWLPLYAICLTLLYFDLRGRKQGYSLDAMANEVGLVDTSTESSP